MYSVFKISLCSQLVTVTLFSCAYMVPLHAAGVSWKLLNTTGLIGSLASFAYWTPSTVNAVNRWGFIDAIKSTHIPRLCIDAICVAAGCYGMRAPMALHIACLLGSTASLATWAPVMATHQNEFLYIARGIIDTTQMALAVHRIFYKIV